MLKRRSTWLGGTGALVLVLSLSGVVAAATALTAGAGTAPVAEPLPAVDTTATFEDVDGNGIDDDCQTETAVADQVAVDAELLTVDVNADGIIQTTEAAHSARIGGTNCNHGGYVSGVSQGEEPTAAEPTTEQAPTDCVEVAPPVHDPALDAQKNGHGKWVSTVAQSNAIGGKNCNHGGAVSEAAKKDQAAAKAARDAAKAERAAARAAAKLARGNAKQH